MSFKQSRQASLGGGGGDFLLNRVRTASRFNLFITDARFKKRLTKGLENNRPVCNTFVVRDEGRGGELREGKE